MVTPTRQHRLWIIAFNLYSYGKIYPVAFIGSLFFCQMTAFFFSIPPIVNFVMIIAILIVWLDGLSTDAGLRKGFEESNPLLKVAQRNMGDSNGIILSRLLPISIILYMGLILQSYYLMIPMIVIFSLCSINNLFRMRNP